MLNPKVAPGRLNSKVRSAIDGNTQNEREYTVMKFFNLRRPFFVVLTLAVGLVRLAMAQDFTISSPNNGDVLGKTNQLKFNINNVSSQAKIVATTVNQANPSTSFRVEGTRHGIEIAQVECENFHVCISPKVAGWIECD